MAKPNAAAPVRVIQETPAYWRLVFDYHPSTLLTRTSSRPSRTFLSEWIRPRACASLSSRARFLDFYLAHFDLTGKLGNIMTAIGASGLPILMDTFVRLTKSPVVSIAKIRGCARGVSSEFVLACDMRFASRENTRLGHPELGVGLHPGGGGTERLPHLVGRDRALEIVLSANDFDGDTAERYGYVNRALPGRRTGRLRRSSCAQDCFSFDRRALAAAKNLVNQVSLPSADRLLDAITSFGTALTWPEAQHRIQAVLERGLQRDTDFEKSWPGGSRQPRRDGKEGYVAMIAKIEIERFSLTTSKPFNEVVAGVNAGIGHPDMADFARSTHEARFFCRAEKRNRERLERSRTNAAYGA